MHTSAGTSPVLPSRSNVQVRSPSKGTTTMIEKEQRWVQRWRTWIASRPTMPGVWRRRDGGYLVRARAVDPRTARLRQVMISLPQVTDASVAFETLQRELRRVRAGAVAAAPQRMRFADYSVSLLERKIRNGDLKSTKSREKWSYVLRCHLLPDFGEVFMDSLRRIDVEEWKARVSEEIRDGKLSPTTANDRLGVLRVIMNTATGELELDRNPMLGVRPFDMSEHATYTDEEPNSLTPDEVPAFLSTMRTLFPQHFAFCALGFATGLRPSSLRPLRRSGSTPELQWDQGVLLVRRSHTRRQDVMERTKTGKRQRIPLPEGLLEILRWHAAQLPAGPMAESELLFPGEHGGYRSPSCLDKPFREVAEALKLTKHITPRAMRRTFQDLARAAEVKELVQRAICGHVTEGMTERYSTVGTEEMRQNLARVIDLGRFRAALDGAGDATASTVGGVKGGVKEPENEKVG